MRKLGGGAKFTFFVSRENRRLKCCNTHLHFLPASLIGTFIRGLYFRAFVKKGGGQKGKEMGEEGGGGVMAVGEIHSPGADDSAQPVNTMQRCVRVSWRKTEVFANAVSSFRPMFCFLLLLQNSSRR